MCARTFTARSRARASQKRVIRTGSIKAARQGRAFTRTSTSVPGKTQTNFAVQLPGVSIPLGRTHAVAHRVLATASLARDTSPALVSTRKFEKIKRSVRVVMYTRAKCFYEASIALFHNNKLIIVKS